jgi:hypothetical protein
MHTELFLFSKKESVTNILPMQIAIQGHIARVIGALSSVKWASIYRLTVL